METFQLPSFVIDYEKNSFKRERKKSTYNIGGNDIAFFIDFRIYPKGNLLMWKTMLKIVALEVP